MKVSFEYTPLEFIRPAGTSRGTLTIKHSWLIFIEENGIVGTGEFSIIPELSPDFESFESYQMLIRSTIENLNDGTINRFNMFERLIDKPSILFGIESAFLDLQNGGKKIYFDNDFSKGKSSIAINGLIWMGDESFMQEQIEHKLQNGFSTIKMKIGAIDFESEYKLLKRIRSSYDKKTITLRVDANGAFEFEKAKEILNRLAEIDIHSIEQPIKAGNWENMAELCTYTPTPIALDEELIGIQTKTQKELLLKTINPQYIILKPSLHGGVYGSNEWIELAEKQNIQWWMTSALESNIGLKVICELTAQYKNSLPQGLGTGSLYVSNFETKLTVANGTIFIKN